MPRKQVPYHMVALKRSRDPIPLQIFYDVSVGHDVIPRRGEEKD